MAWTLPPSLQTNRTVPYTRDLSLNVTLPDTVPLLWQPATTSASKPIPRTGRQRERAVAARVEFMAFVLRDSYTWERRFGNLRLSRQAASGPAVLLDHGAVNDFPARPCRQGLPHGGRDVVGQEPHRAVGEGPVRAPGVLAPEM